MSPINWPNIARQPELVKSGRGAVGHEEPLRVFGVEIYIKVTGAQTGGLWSMIEQITPPNSGPPLHRHSREEEGFFIVEGSFLFLVGEEKIEAHVGDFLWAPRGIPHTFLNIGSSPARVLVTMSPPGMEDFFLKAAALVGPPDPTTLGQMFADFGMELLGPPMTR
jgi:quercetin dioxygenase-like cupin family protein